MLGNLNAFSSTRSYNYSCLLYGKVVTEKTEGTCDSQA